MEKQLESQYFVEDYITDNIDKPLAELLEIKDEALIEEHIGAILLSLQNDILADKSVLGNFELTIPRILSNFEDSDIYNPLLVLIEDALLKAVKVGYLLNSGSIRKSLVESNLRTAIRVPESTGIPILTKIKQKLTGTKKRKKGRRAGDGFREN